MLVMAMAVTACGGGPVRSTLPAPEAGFGEVDSRGDVGRAPEYRDSRDPSISEADLDDLWRLQLVLPVAGVQRSSLRDTFGAGRDNGRTHGALDIMAPRDTPVLAAADCIIGRMSSGALGGNFIYAYDPARRFVFYYAHLSRYRKGLKTGDRIRRGTVIGYVGTTGNAPKDTPHLHFQVMKYGEGRAWWSGPPINPFLFITADGNEV